MSTTTSSASDRQPRIWIFLRVILASLAVLLVVAAFVHVAGSSGPLSEKEKLARGDIWLRKLQFEGAPYACIYLGLTTNEAVAFRDEFTQAAEGYGLRRVTKRYTAYSGGPLANYMSDHVALFVFAVRTTDVQQRHNQCDSILKNQVLEGDWNLAFHTYCLWSTNGSLIIRGGEKLVAPMTGCIHMVSYDEKYPREDFNSLTEALVGALRLAWPDHPIEAVISRAAKDQTQSGGDKRTTRLANEHE